MKKQMTFLLMFFLMANFCFSQNKFFIQNKKRSDKISFKLISNLIVLPVEVNGVQLSFVLDTGVSKPIIFNFLNISDTLKIKETETIFLRGLGEDKPVEALKSKNNIFKIGDAIKLNQDLYAIYDNTLNFGTRLGIPIHGIIGFDFFRDLVVEINYTSKYLRITEPNKFRYKKCKKCERFNLEFYNSKPYINAKIVIKDKLIPVKMLIDSGGSDTIWLFESDSLGIKPHMFFNDFLGHGLSGSVYGKRSKIKLFMLKSFVLQNPNVAYPDSTSVILAKSIKDRNGSIAGNMLKRFNIILDYRNALVTFKKNSNFREKFSYNKSGIELAHDGYVFVEETDNYKTVTGSNKKVIPSGINHKLSLKPAYAIVELRDDSPAKKAGLLIGDVILAVNKKKTHEYTLQQIMALFYDDIGKKIHLKIQRADQYYNYTFNLESPFK